MKVKITCILLGLFIFLLSICGCNGGGCNSKVKGKNRCAYNINVEFLNDKINGNLLLDYVDEKFDTSYLLFYLYANAYGENAVNYAILPERYQSVKQGSYGNILINDVKIQNKRVAYELIDDDNLILKICLPNILKANNFLQIEILFTVNLQYNNHRLGINEDCVNVSNFYPVLVKKINGEYLKYPYCAYGEPYFYDYCDYNVNITLPSTFVLCSSGKTTECNVLGEKTIYKQRLQNARDFAFCISEKFKVVTKKSDFCQINYCYINDEFADESINFIESVLKFYNKKIHKYGYNVFNIAQTNYCQSGTAFPTFCYIDKNLNGDQFKEGIVFQIAHQYFPTLVGNDEFSSGYFDEGLTQILFGLYYESQRKGYLDELYERCVGSYKNNISVLNALGKKVSNSMQRNLNDFSGEFEYYTIAYIKGYILFYEIAKTVGQEKFCTALNRFINENKYSNGDVIKFINSFAIKKGCVKKIFNAFVKGEGILYLQN